MAPDNRTLGRFMLDGILPAPRGVPQVEVSFDIDANGILSVKAIDKGTGREQKITITASSGLNKEEVEKLQKEAELHATEDAKRREAEEARKAAELERRVLQEATDKSGQVVDDDLEDELSDELDGLD